MREEPGDRALRRRTLPLHQVANAAQGLFRIVAGLVGQVETRQIGLHLVGLVEEAGGEGVRLQQHYTAEPVDDLAEDRVSAFQILFQLEGKAVHAPIFFGVVVVVMP